MTNYLKFAAALALLLLTNGCTSPVNPPSFENVPDRRWWKEAVVYQIYPRSFKDSNGDGIGDLRGIISELDYVKSLGIDAVWINPVYSSPNFDNGYDISDYQNINPEFGTMADFDTLLAGMKERNIKVIMDMVLNHCSIEHEWFKQARSSRDNPYRDYFIWWPAEKGTPVPRFSFFDVKSDAWEYDKTTDAYYYHLFSDQQPDLNWDNPKLRQEIYKMMRFWLDKGVDGFRMDAFQYISKDQTWPVYPDGYTKEIAKYYGNGPHLHEYIQEMNKEVFAGKDIMTVAEGAGSSPEEAMLFVAPERNEFSMAYHFEGVDFGFVPNEFKTMVPEGLDLVGMKKIYAKWDKAFAQKGWNSIFLANHDQPRIVSRWGDDSPEFRDVSAKMLMTFLLSMRGTPFTYYGDELGMSNIRFDKIEDYNDIETKNQYEKQKAEGKDMAKFIEHMKMTARDNGRTPMQWSAEPNGGFTTGTPWLRVNSNLAEVNVTTQNTDPNSNLSFFRKMVALRKSDPALIYGEFKELQPNSSRLFAYTRTWEGRTLLVLLNFSARTVLPDTGKNLSKSRVLIHNYPAPPTSRELRPYEALVYELF